MGPIGKLDSAVKLCFDFNGFHPETASELVGGHKGFMPVADPNPYSSPLSRATEMLSRAELTPLAPKDGALDLSGASDFIDRTTQSLDKLSGQISKNRDLIDSDDKILTQIAPMLGIKTPLSKIFGLEYIKFRFGKLPRDSYEKVMIGREGQQFIYMPSSIEEEYVWGIYFAPRGAIERVDATFASLHFERIWISSRADGIPSEVYDILGKEERTLSLEIEKLQKERDAFLAEHRDKMLETTAVLQYHSDLFECRKLAMRTANNFFFGGWVAKDRAEEFQKLLESLDGITCITEAPEDNSALPTPPTRLKNRWFFRPFETFVKMYGLPRYGEIDPTPLVALTYCILFGLMFGDVGQGAVIAAIGFIMYRVKRADFGKILASIGLFSVAGGFLYGSVFGYEVLPGLRPLEDSNLFNMMMFASIGFGVVLIIVTMTINIINSIRRKNFTEGLFGNNGIAGVLFYLAIVVGVLGLFGFGQSVFTVPYILVFVVLPLLAMFLKEPLGKLVKRQKDVVPKKKGEFILENFFELFDVLLSYITNTISFVRIAAFALNHAGMMMFVFILARMGGSENLAIVIIGNIIVIGLEGFIVGIQTLRLEFYELFSRFFSGEGREFRPINKLSSKLK